MKDTNERGMRARLRVALANFNSIWFVPGVRILFACLVLWLAGSGDTLCAPKELRTPPVGDTIRADVMRGGATSVTLKAVEGRGNPLEYEIVALPRHGRLEDFRQADDNTQGYASVNYVHGNDELSLEDEFTFRARALVGGGTSSPIKVKLRIVDAPPQLRTAPVVNFSALAGESDSQQIVLANAGGGLIEGRIAPKAPFHVDGDGRFSLGRGQTTNVVVRFSPQEAGSVPPQKLSPAPADPGATLTLTGEAKAPFFAAANPLEVQADGARKGAISITNFSRSPISVGIALAEEKAADVAPDAQIPGEGTAELPVVITADKAGGEDELRITVSSPFHLQELAVPAPAVPPKLELVTPELDFRTGNEAVLVVGNTGGVEGRCSLELPESIKSIEGAQTFAVAPGTARKIPLRHVGVKNAPSAEALIVSLGRAGKVPVALLFADTASAPEPEPEPSPTETEPEPPLTTKTKPWELGRDVKLETAGEQNFIAWRRGNGVWTDARLEIVTAEGAQVYQWQKEKVGWWDWLKNWLGGRAEEAKEAWREKEQFFGDRLTPPNEKEDGERASETSNEEWQREAVAEETTGDGAPRWRVTAARDGKDGRSAVSEDFSIDWQTLALIKVPEEKIEESEHLEPAEAEPVIARRTTALPAVRKIPFGRVDAERTHATLTISIDADPDITGFRLEKCEIVDPFSPIPHDGKSEIVAIHPSIYEGKPMITVVAQIDGLLAGTRTLWRLVPLAGDTPLTPTGEFDLVTKPPFVFPWYNFSLFALTAVLAAVLWLRHRQRKAEYR